MLLTEGHQKSNLNTQIAIVGSGPAGIAAALELEKLGHEVLIIESGQTKSTKFATSLAKANEITPFHVPPEDLGNRRLGGASWTWGGRCVPYDQSDFDHRPYVDHSGWPVSLNEMTAMSSPAATFLGIGSDEFQTDKNSDLKDWPTPVVLERWCADPLLLNVHKDALIKSDSIKLLLGTTCTIININEHGHVDRLECQQESGKKVTITADKFIVATGGLETARLLLWAFAKRPEHAKPTWLGRGYMGHLSGKIANIKLSTPFSDAFDYFRAPENCFARRRIQLDPDKLRANKLRNISFIIENPPFRDPEHKTAGLSAVALALSVPGLSKYLTSETMRQVLIGDPLTQQDCTKHIANIIRAPQHAASFGIKAFAGRLRAPKRPGVIAKRKSNQYMLEFSAEQSPSFDSKVSLSQETDALGLPRLDIQRKIEANDVSSVIKTHALLGKNITDKWRGRTYLSSVL